MKNQVRSKFNSKERSYIDIVSPEWKIDPDSRFFCLGSCFADNFHDYFSRFYLDSFRPDFGSVYNPLSAASILSRLISQDGYSEKYFFFRDGRWLNFDFSTYFTDPDKGRLTERCQDTVKMAGDALLQADYLILTLGTSFAYRLKERNLIVNNCHKLPAAAFDREFISPQDSSTALAKPLKALLQHNPGLNIIISVSPVRHLRDNPHENTLSKSALQLALHQLQGSVPHFYFPAFEIMLDELRDYRWFAEDLTHPSPIAAEYIMERFGEACGSEAFLEYLQSVAGFNRDMAHRVEFPESETAVKFRLNRMKKLEALKVKYPEITGLNKLKLDS